MSPETNNANPNTNPQTREGMPNWNGARIEAQAEAANHDEIFITATQMYGTRAEAEALTSREHYYDISDARELDGSAPVTSRGESPSLIVERGGRRLIIPASEVSTGDVVTYPDVEPRWATWKVVWTKVQEKLGLGTSLTPWQSVEAAIKKHFDKPDLQAARAFFSAIAAHKLRGQPVWPMLVGPPGSMKTELLNGLEQTRGVHFIDAVTSNTFISGQIKVGKDSDKKPSLLHRIGRDGIIIYADFSTVLGMRQEERAAILAIMRRIFDGKYSKEFGTDAPENERTWEGRITFAVGVTQEIDRHYSIFQTLGERFVMIRLPRAEGIEAGLAAINQDHSEVKKDLRLAVHRLIADLPSIKPEASFAMQRRIVALTEIAVRGRTQVPRDGYSKHIVYVPDAESNTRLAQQMYQLARGSALLDHREDVNEDDFALVKRVVFDSLPPLRSQILQTLLDGGEASQVNAPPSTRSYALEDLIHMELIVKTGDRYQLSEYAMKHFDIALDDGFSCFH